jgi:hypothetical protein
MMHYRKPGMRLGLLLFLLSASLRAKKAQGALLNLVVSTTSERRDDESAIGAGPLEPLIGSLRTKYRGLTPKGKFIAMAATGFIGSRLVMDVAATSLKVAGAVFIVYVRESTADQPFATLAGSILTSLHFCCSAEVLHYTGVLDELPSLSGEQRNFLEQAQSELRKRTDAFRIEVRRRLNPQSVQSWIDQDRLGALGLAAGSFVGTIL